jgi:hypothetical protein
MKVHLDANTILAAPVDSTNEPFELSTFEMGFAFVFKRFER